ncbi:Dehydrogenase citC [Drechslerella dactyloides]|uniref:Dehydrogenase citC n=1 Tax=Drechslerella dactyloides TaxID=74499 RepID=A0AAD6J4X1_DREDA|nr:Dehydrogenase citC [Drechslerella dactyloides]
MPIVSPSEFASQTFDYIVVGGGTAGLVLASRLTENSQITVGVIEAGSAGFGDPLIDTPGQFGAAIHTKYDWEFETTLQAGLGGRKLEWARGKVLGGSSAINFYTWMRGNKEDYDAWEALGNRGWGWESMLPFFKKVETFFVPSTELTETHKLDYRAGDHGSSGPIRTSYSKRHAAHHKYWHETLQNLGVARRPTFDGSNVGVWTGLTSVNPDTAKRSYAASEYYLPFASRENLLVICDSIAREVLLETSAGRATATGVRFASEGVEYNALARAEVIVSCGSVQSPLILELSGIGNPEVLGAANIGVKIENCNVGENLQDRLMAAMVYEIDPSDAKDDDLLPDSNVLPCSFAYLPLTQFMGESEITELAAKARCSSLGTSNVRDRVLVEKLTSGKPLGQMEFVFDARNWYPVFQLEDGKKYGTMLQMLQYPFSTGCLHIPPKPHGKDKTNSDDKPIIDPRYYQEDGAIDQFVMAAALKFAHKVTKTAPLSNFVKRRVFPPLDNNGDEEDFLEYAKNHTISDWHPTGTCAMGGSEGNKYGVVNERLKVYGTTNLRVIDASIMPLQISCHPQATVYAIAEKGASMILEDRKRGPPGHTSGAVSSLC